MFNAIADFFGAPPIDFSTIDDLVKDSPSLVLYAVPVLLFFTAVEIFISYRQNRQLYDTKETIGTILSGIGNLVINFFIKALLVYGTVLAYNFVPWRMPLVWWTLIPCSIAYDLFSYWAHRISHFNRFFWATHVLHHSGEHYNLTVSFRQSWIQHFKIFFFVPVALMGFHPVIFFITYQVAVLFQFWQHTEYIRKLHPVIEYFIATPSNHRVHHGSDAKYIDKNFGAMFIIWDRMFGTYQKEEEKPTYGITNKLEQKLNPFYLNFHELRDIYRDMKKAKGFRSKMFYLFGSPVKIAMEKKERQEKGSV